VEIRIIFVENCEILDRVTDEGMKDNLGAFLLSLNDRERDRAAVATAQVSINARIYNSSPRSPSLNRSQVISRLSHDRAKRHSRSTVEGEISKISATSF
jgi:hypothetical protein